MLSYKGNKGGNKIDLTDDYLSFLNSGELIELLNNLDNLSDFIELVFTTIIEEHRKHCSEVALKMNIVIVDLRALIRTYVINVLKYP